MGIVALSATMECVVLSHLGTQLSRETARKELDDRIEDLISVNKQHLLNQ